MSTPARSARDRGAPLPRGETVVEFLDVWKRYGAREILAGVNLSVFRGEVLCILGPSGTGKSVTLRHINGLTKPDDGDVRVFGESVVALSEEELSPIRRRLAMLFQGGALFDSMNVEQNIAFPLKEHTEKSPKEISELVAEKLQLVGPSGDPEEDAVGALRRNEEARRSRPLDRARARDHPLRRADDRARPLTSEKIAQLIVDINLRLRTTSVVVTHDIVAARTVADRLAFLHQGRFQFVGTFDEAARGAHPVLSEYFRSMGFPCGTGAFPAVGGGT